MSFRTRLGRALRSISERPASTEARGKLVPESRYVYTPDRGRCRSAEPASVRSRLRILHGRMTSHVSSPRFRGTLEPRLRKIFRHMLPPSTNRCERARKPRVFAQGPWALTARFPFDLRALLLLFAPCFPGRAEEPAGGDLVPCPACEASGFVVCSECKGRGEIYRLCEICGGKGEKPCPVCTKERPNRPKTAPGTVPCGFCGGKGTVGSDGRVCPRCGGASSEICETCWGTGVVRCRKEVFVRICPKCKFLGKVKCSLCNGEKLVTQAAAASAQARPARVEAKPKSEPNHTVVRPAQSPGNEESSEQVYPIEEVRARYETLAPICEAHYDIFVEDQIPRAENVRLATVRLMKALDAARSRNEELRKEIQVLSERVENFRRRWNELKAHFLLEHRAYSSMKENWKLREETLATVAAAYRRKAEADWDRRLSTLLGVLEKHAAPLQSDDPGWIPEEIAAIEKAATALEKKVAAEIAALKEKEQLASATQTQSDLRKPGKGPAVVAEPPAPARAPEPVPAQPAAPPETGRQSKAPHPVAEAPPRSEEAAEEDLPLGAEGKSPVLNAFLWALVGFTVACVIFGLSRRLTRDFSSEP